MDIAATSFEVVFNDEYWQPIPPPREFQARHVITRVKELMDEGLLAKPTHSHEQKQLIKHRLGQAVMNILTDDPGTRIPDGSLVGGKGDVRYTAPGNVVLIDEERVVFKKNSFSLVADGDMEEQEVTLPVIDYFKQNLNIIKPKSFDQKNWRELKNLKRFPLIDDKQGLYERDIKLYAFFKNKKDELSAFYLNALEVDKNGQHIPAPDVLLGYTASLVPGFVGKTSNVSIGKRHTAKEVHRIREAYLCIDDSDKWNV